MSCFERSYDVGHRRGISAHDNFKSEQDAHLLSSFQRPQLTRSLLVLACKHIIDFLLEFVDLTLRILDKSGQLCLSRGIIRLSIDAFLHGLLRTVEFMRLTEAGQTLELVIKRCVFEILCPLRPKLLEARSEVLVDHLAMQFR